ncbi:hypothetical protein FRC19_006390 [Serendipita sp. 401]|nr:hypothetical protein FRC19_006390 [Serendipita sp. 401]
MPTAKGDSIALYSEGTFDEHIQELANYLARNKTEEDRTLFIKPFVEALIPREDLTPFEEDPGRRREVLEMVLERMNGVGEGTEKEIEGFFNLLMAYTLDSYPDPATPIGKLLSSILTAQRPPSIKYRLLSNVFNALPQASPLRPKTFLLILNLASKNDELDVLHLHKAEVDKWLEEWDITVEERAQFCKEIADALFKASQPAKAYPYLILRAQILPSNSPNANSSVMDALISGLRLSSIYNFEPIIGLQNINLVREHPLFKLLKIFLRSGMKEWQEWVATNEAELTSCGLDRTSVEKKIRLVTLTELVTANIGKTITYAEIASTIQVTEAEVENWVIQAIRAKLIVGKLDQTTRTFAVVRSTTRQFTPGDWEALDDRLEKWKATLVDILSVVSAARKKATGPTGAAGITPVAAS